MGDSVHAYKIFIGKSERKIDHLGDMGIDVKITLKLMLKSMV
jgi:hypothetical protein